MVFEVNIDNLCLIKWCRSTVGQHAIQSKYGCFTSQIHVLSQIYIQSRSDGVNNISTAGKNKNN